MKKNISHIILLLSLVFLFSYTSVLAQVQLVKDINTAATITGSWPYGFMDVNGTIFFSASDGSNGIELWKSDGTTNGTVLVKDIYSGSNSSSPNNFLNVNGTLFFTATNAAYGIELWKSDGTAAGTVLIKDIYLGTSGSNPGTPYVINGIIYFPANDGVNGVELWRSDGTAAGTYMVKDIYPGSLNGVFNSMCVMGTELFFLANDGVNSYEFWKSDGTAIGTNMVKDINPGASGSTPNNFMVMNGAIYFQADDGTNGNELWKSNGTTGGTSLLKDINPGAGNSNPRYLIAASSTLFYFQADNGTTGEEPWKSDGTDPGTVLLQDINTGSASSNIMNTIVKVGTQIYFTAYEGTNGYELWTSDGTSTSMVKDIFPGAGSSGPNYLTERNGSTVYFNADDGSNGKELWRSDGTPGGTVMVKDIYPGVSDGNPGGIANINGTLYFLAYNPANGAELWTSDGTTGGTNLLKNIAPDIGTSAPDNFVKVLNTLFFSSNDGTNGIELWKSDGTAGGTVMVKDIYAGANNSYSSAGVSFKDTLFFVALDGGSTVVWKSDGTLAGTVKVKPSGGYTYFSNTNYRLTPSGNNIFFCGQDGGFGQELWKTDGTDAGTVRVRNISSGDSKPNGFTDVNGIVFFSADNNMNGYELWKSDGTMAGTVMVKDICVGGGCSSFIYPVPAGSMINRNDTLLFQAFDGVNGFELWKSDGTSGGTVLVKDIYSGGNSAYPSNLTNVNSLTFFSANDNINGTELWKTDGTTGGTVIVKDIFPGSSSSYPTNLKNINGKLFFSAIDSANGNELWMSDGTSTGTVRVKDIYAGTGSSSPASFAEFNLAAFFTADDGNSGAEIWTSTGTAIQTALSGDVNPGAGSSSPANLTAVNSTLFFSANDGSTGTELWKLNLQLALTDTGMITNLTCNGNNSGAINLSVSNGNPPYTFLWSNGATTEDISALSADTFSVVILDSWGWTIADTFIVTEPTALTVTLSSQTNVTCNGGNNGAVDISVSGGTTPYTFAWSNFSTTEDISVLIAGNYSVLITDANNCTQTFSTSITQPLSVAATTSVTNTSCFGGNDGTASVNVTTGVSPYTYLWDASTGSQTTQTATALSIGTYSVTVTDATGCTGTFADLVIQPPAYSTTVAITPVVCNGASNGGADLSVSGSTPPYTYSWSSGATTQDITNMMAGTYTFTITDSKGCTKTDVAVITQPALLNPNFSHTDVTCNGLCNGTATVNPTGGTSPYIYSWQTSPVQTSQTATGLCPGNYNITITDNNGCVNVPSITISQPFTLTISISVTDATCNNSDGSATANVSGGTSPYTFNWSNGNSNQTANNLAAGNYSVSITDANGCTASATATVSVVSLPQPICMITVDSISTYNQIAWEKPVSVPIDSFRIYREIASVFTPIATVPFSQLSFYTDTTNGVNPNITSYKYKVSAIDSCGNESALSSFHQTMHLSVSPAIPPASYNLFWNDYIGITITQYVIMRDSSFTGWSAIDSVSFGNNAWTDTQTYLPTDTISYYIRIDHQTGCVATIKNPQPMVTNLNSSRSNNYRVQDSTVVSVNNISDGFIANVYPNPNSGVFNVQMSKFENVQMKIYNLYGECIHQQICTSAHQQIDVRGFSKGVYHLRVTSGNSIINKKIIIQ